MTVQTQTSLFTPPWWNSDDAGAVATYLEWERTDWWPATPDGMDLDEWAMTPTFAEAAGRVNVFLDSHADGWTCRRCSFWISADGVTGECPRAGDRVRKHERIQHVRAVESAVIPAVKMENREEGT